MEYIITKTKYMGNDSETHEERFEGDAQEIAELLRLTVGMNECCCEEVTVTVEEDYDKNTFKIHDIKEFKKDRMAVNCKTKELAKEFINKLNELGIKWCNHPDTSTFYNIYEEDTCYTYDSKNECLMYSDVEYFKDELYKIKEFKGW